VVVVEVADLCERRRCREFRFSSASRYDFSRFSLALVAMPDSRPGSPEKAKRCILHWYEKYVILE
jgi:hypothetical protein